jgi:DMSO/TMAO reductase YedYZ molybdopterin-dependent catalytic subunit
MTPEPSAQPRPLPPGQWESRDFPRFGMSQFAGRFPKETRRIELQLGGDVEHPALLRDELRGLTRVEQTCDFHCVTTWTCSSLRWSGYRFSELYRSVVMPMASPHAQATFVVLRCQDGYRASLPLADLLADDVLLADMLDGNPLSLEHGAPLRLVAPAHYGYKSVKHLNRIDFWRDDRSYRPAGFRFMDHPRARVVLEERGRGVPGWLLRFLYRPLVAPTTSRFQRALDRHRACSDRNDPDPS